MVSIISFYRLMARPEFNDKLSIISEAMRIEPLQFPFAKICTESIELQDYDGHSVTIETGTKIILPMDALQKHPDFFPNADQFDTDRFDRNLDNAKKLKEAGVFLPFGNGPRSCLGKYLHSFFIWRTISTVCRRKFNGFRIYCRYAICSYINKGCTLCVYEQFRDNYTDGG